MACLEAKDSGLQLTVVLGQLPAFMLQVTADFEPSRERTEARIAVPGPDRGTVRQRRPTACVGDLLIFLQCFFQSRIRGYGRLTFGTRGRTSESCKQQRRQQRTQ